MLSIDTGCGVAYLRGAIIVDRRAANNSVDMVTIFDRIFQTLQHNYTSARPRNSAGGRGIKSAAMAVARQNHPGIYRYPSGCGSEIETPPASAMSHSLRRRLSKAICTATSEVEQAVCTPTAGPLRFSL